MIRFAILAAVIAAPTLARADDRDAQAHAKADEATALFNKDDYAGAAAKFAEAYELNHDASYLFNIAQAYRHAGDCTRAADYYARFLAEVPHPPNESKIRGWYAAQSACAKQHATTVVEPPKPEPPPMPAPPPPPPPPAERPAPEPPAPQPAVAQTHGHRAAAFALLGGGGIALGLGGFFAWDAHYLGNQRDALLSRCSTQMPCSSALVRDYNDRGSRANLLSITGFVAGGAAIAAGVTVLMLSRPEGDDSIAVIPVSGGAIATRAFRF